MDIHKLLLVCIIFIVIILFLNQFDFTKELINNDSPNNNIVAMGESNILIPTSDQVYNPFDSNRESNDLSHQETPIISINQNTDYVNTDIDIPLVYSIDEIEDTTIKTKYTPSYLIDTGSGIIDKKNIDTNNDVLYKLKSIN
jgi:hypothetical protein